jgi:hypothetical protein
MLPIDRQGPYRPPGYLTVDGNVSDQKFLAGGFGV